MASPPPVRTPAGATTDPPYGPLAQCGMGNPFFYHQFYDDFDANLNTGATGIWTQTKTGNGTIVHTAGDGGLALFTTNSTTPAGTDQASIQLPAASFSLTAGKKQFFLCRFQLSSATNAGFLCGLTNTAANPFTGTTDGIYFLKASGSLTNLILRTSNTSVNVDIAIPTAAYALANATNLDLGFFVDRNQTLFAFVGSQLVGYMPQSGTGGVNSAGVSVLPVTGPVADASTAAGQTLNPTAITWSPTSANLNLTLGILSGTAASSTMTSDFILAAKER